MSRRPDVTYAYVGAQLNLTGEPRLAIFRGDDFQQLQLVSRRLAEFAIGCFFDFDQTRPANPRATAEQQRRVLDAQMFREQRAAPQAQRRMTRGRKADAVVGGVRTHRGSNRRKNFFNSRRLASRCCCVELRAMSAISLFARST